MLAAEQHQRGALPSSSICGGGHCNLGIVLRQQGEFAGKPWGSWSHVHELGSKDPDWPLCPPPGGYGSANA